MKRILPFLLAVAAMAQTATVVIVPEPLVSAANQTALIFDPIGGTNTFTAPLVISGTTNIYGRWCAARFSVTNRALLSQLAATPPFAGQIIVEDYMPDSDPGAPFRLLSTNGLAVFAPPMFGN